MGVQNIFTSCSTINSGRRGCRLLSQTTTIPFFPFPIFPSPMTSTDPPPFQSFFNDPNLPRSRQKSASTIWAPQPQQSDATWPKAFDAFSRVVTEEELKQDLRIERYRSNPFPVLKEDVFGPVSDFRANAPKGDVGAIGDGRKKNSPDFDDSVRDFRARIFSVTETRLMLACRAASSRFEPQFTCFLH